MPAFEVAISICLSWIAAKSITLISNSIRAKKLSFETLVMDGGFASAHSAAVTALAVATAFETGFSPLFVFTGLFALIIMNDAMHVRHYVGEHSRILNKMITKEKLSYALQEERCGHTMWQVITGFFVALIVTIICFKLIFPVI
ncbi:MAG: divergent PAP2 family protein [Candidatus Woesearchaeota archaeon]